MDAAHYPRLSRLTTPLAITHGTVVPILSHGVTVVRNMSGSPYHLALQRQIRQKDLPGPLLFTTSPLIEGGPPVHWSWRVMTHADEAAHLVQSYAQRGYQQIKIYNQLKPEVVRAMGRAAQEIGIRMVGHCPNTMTFEEASEAGQSCFEHLTGIWRGHFKAGYEQQPDQFNLDREVLQMVNEQIDDDAIRRLGSSFATHQIWNCPTLVTYHYMLDAEDVCCADPEVQPYLRYVPQQALKTWEALDPSRSQAPSTFEPWIRAIHRRNETFSRLVSLLHQEGAPLLIGTDTSVRYVIQGLSIHQELDLFVAAGLRPFEALRCATSEAARFLGQENEWGTITMGKRANLLLLAANPLENIQAACQVEAVCVNSFYLSRKDLDAMLSHLEQAASSGPPQSLPRIELGPLTDNGEVVAQGTWQERYLDYETGYLAYRHCRLPDETWLVEEHHVFEYGELFSQGGQQHQKTLLSLAPDGTIRRLTQTRESWLGSEQREIIWSETGAYVIRRKEIDGYEQAQTVTSIPLLAADTLSFTSFPLLIKNNVDLTERLALSVDETGIHVIMLKGVCQTETAQDGEKQWQIAIHRPDMPIQLIMHMSEDGIFLRMEQTGRIPTRVFAAPQQ